VVADYATARATFLAAAESAGWPVLSYPTGQIGRCGEPLVTDVAMSPDEGELHAALVLSSGLHGVEGPFGSAVQTGLLAGVARPDVVPPGVRIVLVHALNPFGYSWGRRVDSENVDLNRAFRAGNAAPASGDAAYAGLDSLLNPQRPPGGFDPFVARLLWAALARGTSVLRRAIASGQRSFPKGLFYGGANAPALQHLLEREMPGWIGGAESVLHLDLHTGLGRRGERQLIIDYPIAEVDRRWWHEVFRAERVVESVRQAEAYTAQGSLGQWIVAQRLAPICRFAFAEFGTMGDRHVLSALRAENQAHFWAPPGDPSIARATNRLLDAFCPRDPRWRTRAVGAAIALVERAVSVLALA
jgi:hypothetical protein